MNKVILVGRLTRDPEVRTMPNGNPVASFSLAINRPFKNKDGNVDADFINVSIFGRQAENVGKYVTKGSLVGCEGRIQTRSYDAQDGTKRYVTEIIADNVTFLGSKGSNNMSGETSFVGAGNDIATTDISEDPFKDFGSEVALSDDDLPF